MTTPSALLAVEKLSVDFGGLHALRDVYLELFSQEVVGVIGPNGAGKSTLFNALCGIVEPSEGSLTLNGKSHKWPKTHELAKLGIARTLQGVDLFPDLSVLENVMIGAQKFADSGFISAAFGRSRDESKLRDRAMHALEKVYGTGLAHRRADSLSYPDTKRVSIARALVSEPKILLLDEPAGGLGEEDIAWMNGLIHNLKLQCSVLLVEHHMDVVMSVCDRVYVLNFGEIISSGKAETVRRDPAVIAAYLGADVQ